MKTSGLIISLALIVVMGIAGSASAQCTAVLADGLFPTGGSVQVGDTIEYLMTVSVPDVAGYCTLYDVDLYFFPPAGEPDPCDNTGSGILIASGLTLTPGGPVYTYTSADNPALAHVVTLGDLTDADGAVIAADMATSFYIEGGTGAEQCDESSSVVYGTNPCVEITKDACGFSKVGDDITYTICITNCSNPPAPLYNVVVTDPLLGGTLPGFPSELAPDQEVCLDFVYTVQGGDPDPLVNTADVMAEDEYGNIVTDEDGAEVDLLHPSFDVEVDCLTSPVEPGGLADFGVTIENTGDVALNFTTDDTAVPPFTLDAGGSTTVTVSIMDPGGVACVPYDITVTATIPPDFCNLPNILTDYAEACCPVDGPCIDITKEVECDISKVGDEVVYEICITNCSDPAATLYNVVVSDPLLGGTLAGFPSELAPGQSACVSFPYTVQADDPDPLVNTVTVNAESEYGTAVSDLASEEVDLIHPEIGVEAECLTDPVPSGGDADFQVTISNTGDVDLIVTTDEASITDPFTVAAGGTFQQVVTVTDPGGVDCVPFDITVTATIPPEYCELPNVLTDYAEACCPISNPCIEVDKWVECDISKVGDEVLYTVCINNCSNPAAPLYNIVVTDPMLGGVLDVFPSELGPGEYVCLEFPYTIQEGDADPLVNTVIGTAENEYGMAVADTSFATVDLIHPGFYVTKECLTDPVAPGGDAEFGITIVNTGDCDLDISTNEAAIAPFTLDAGGTFMQTVTVTDPGGVDCIYNEIIVTATIPAEYCELQNVYHDTADACCPVEGGEEGCTPGYWGQPALKFEVCWCDDFSPDDLVSDVFDIPAQFSALGAETLEEAVTTPGGGGLMGAANQLMFHAVAAILNACHPDISYPMGVQAIINDVNEALATLDEGEIGSLKDMLDMYNNLGCSIDAHCDPIEDDPEKGLFNDTLGAVVNPTELRSTVVEKAFAQAVPNPFNESVRIQFGLPTSGNVSIDVYDVSGRHVASVMSENKSAGTHEAIWNGTNSRGSRVPTGVYFYKLSLGSETLLKKMLMMD